MNKQREILIALSKSYGLNISQAEEIFKLFGEFIAKTISDPNKKLDNLYDIEKFPTIHIDHFGKFIPVPRTIKHANTNIKKKLEDEHNI